MSQISRRQFLGRAAAVAAAAGTVPRVSSTASAAPTDGPPNILVILVDQLRTPQWFPNQAALDRLLPQNARLRDGAVSFGRHYTAATACTPSRACLLTGLYTHQTIVLNTTATNAEDTPGFLNPGFPTWGTLLRDFGYRSWWYGKWHLSAGDTLAPYGFEGGTFPSPNGAPGQGQFVDPRIVDQFTGWLGEHGGQGPWCTAVSLVNPHDIAWYPRLTRLIPEQRTSPRVFDELPPNFENRAQIRTRKPSLQRAFQQSESVGFGLVRYTGRGFERDWTRMLDLYLEMQQQVDAQIGRVLDALEARPDVAARTVIVFTSDHGEYGGSHGMRGKGGGAYEEAIRVPLYVKDPRGVLTAKPGRERRQLTSSVDVAPMLLTIAGGGGAWRSDARYAHLAGRPDLIGITTNPGGAGRSYVLNTTDEPASEELALTPYAKGAPFHVIAMRTRTSKLATYSHWRDGGIEILPDGQERECYDYASRAGRLELDNRPDSPLSRVQNQRLVDEAIPGELRQPLPPPLAAVQQQAHAAFAASQLARRVPGVAAER